MSRKEVDEAPKSLRDPAVRTRRLAMVEHPHVAPLSRFVRRICREQHCTDCVPYFDPLDGGVRARALFLLEAPGRKAVVSGFISRNNDDETAKNMLGLLAGAGIARRDTVLWNVVPWYIGDGRRIRAARNADFALARRHLTRLIELLPRLRVVVLVGLKAQAAWDLVGLEPRQIVVRTWHPSAQVMNRWPERRRAILTKFRQVRSHLMLR